jgi:predicted dehydrogenase
LIRIGVVGVGHFGRHHVRIFSTLDSVELVGIVDKNPQRAKYIGEEFKVSHYTDIMRLVDKVDAVSVAVPTIDHYSVAKEFLQRGIAVLVEKPITSNLKEADRLVELANKKGLPLQVGFLERFNPAVIEAIKRVESPRFIETDRIGSFAARSLDVDVILDLMIHDIDIALSIAKSDVEDLRAVGVPVLTDKIDLANARLEFQSGCIANLTASRVSPEKTRKLRIFQSDNYISVDYANQEIVISHLAKSPQNGSPVIGKEEIKIKKDEPLKKELESFINAVVNGKEVLIDGEQAKKSLQIAFKILEKI